VFTKVESRRRVTIANFELLILIKTCVKYNRNITDYDQRNIFEFNFFDLNLTLFFFLYPPS